MKQVSVSPGCPQGIIYNLTRGVMAVKAKLMTVKEALVSGKVDNDGVEVALLTQFDAGEWQLVRCGLLQTQAATDLSRILKTQAMHLYYDDPTGTIGYEIYEEGVIVETLLTICEEDAEFMEDECKNSLSDAIVNHKVNHEGTVICFESRLSKVSKKALVQDVEKFIDIRFKELGIGIPKNIN